MARIDAKQVGEIIATEFSYRRQVALRCGYREITSRLIGFVKWMNSIKLLTRLLKDLKREGNADDIMYKEQYGSTYCRDPIEAQTVEEVAAVGLALINLAEKREEHLYKVGESFGIRSDRRTAGPAPDSEAVISRYVIPFLDYLEQRLPKEQKPLPLSNTPSVPAIIFDSLKKFRQQHRNVGGRCFIMMRFGETSAHKRIEAAIKDTLTKHKLVGVLARDKEFHEDLFPNILTYVYGCDFGIAVFERIETEIFNPNVALEVGYMMGLKKHVLLLKDQTLRALQTDLVGKLYRKFDPQKPKNTISREIESWLNDKGLR